MTERFDQDVEVETEDRRPISGTPDRLRECRGCFSYGVAPLVSAWFLARVAQSRQKTRPSRRSSCSVATFGRLTVVPELLILSSSCHAVLQLLRRSTSKSPLNQQSSNIPLLMTLVSEQNGNQAVNPMKFTTLCYQVGELG